MLQQGIGACRHRCNDLLIRMHVLPRMRRKPARWALPKLLWQSCATPNPARVKARG